MALAHDHHPNEPHAGRPLARTEYDELVRRGVLEDAKVELLYGRIVSMSPQGNAHRYSVTRLTRLLVQAVNDRALVCVQVPFGASDESEPEPDLAVVPPGDYLDDHPRSALLVIEVADSSLATDRGKKKSLYAMAGVPEYWIVNLADECVEVHREPAGDAYVSVTSHGRGQTLTVRALEDVAVRVDDVLPPRRG